MRVSFERTGGFAGMRVSTVIETDSLPPEEAVKLRELVRAANLPEIAKESPSPGHPDQYSYRLTIAEGDQTQTIYVPEPDVTPELRPLLDWLVAKVRKRQ